MGNISGQDELVTKQELAAFYQAILPYLGNSSSGGGTTYTAGDGIDIINDIISTKKSTSNDMDEIIDTLPTGSSITTVSGYTPLGTIISYYGETAPRFYLACDGSEYNKSDYPELANHLLSLTNHSQYEVSGDNTKFKVPDLRGEFLRGTGTNTYTNQGSGANVGVHQNATQHVHPYVFYNGTDNGACFYLADKGGSGSQRFLTVAKNLDKGIDAATCFGVYNKNISITVQSGLNAWASFTSRPTNTSVLYCIAYKDIYTNPMNDYSTDEKVVGTWIDGKPLYQKTINFGALPNTSTKTVTLDISNLSKCIKIYGYAFSTGHSIYIPLPVSNINSSPSNDGQAALYIYQNNINIITKTDMRSYDESYVTLQYTKTTD